MSERIEDGSPPRAVGLIVIDTDGVERPGYILRAGDYITSTHYEHDWRRLTVTVGPRAPRWWERLLHSLRWSGTVWGAGQVRK